MDIAQQLVQALEKKQWKIRCVESCTAGALTAAIGEISGASAVLDRSWVTYSNQSKIEEVGVPLATIETYGAVSAEVVTAMAEGAVKDCASDTVSVAISGIAGPDGGTKDKPVGTVWIGLTLPQSSTLAQCFLFEGNRQSVQEQTVQQALEILISKLIQKEG